jgi:DNA end-binding protein Ku
MARPIWSGTITFGLVSVPVRLFVATRSHDISFHLLHGVCSTRIQLQNYCPHCKRVVERSELVKGYEYEKGEYAVIDSEELEKIKPESSTNLDIQQFIDLNEIDPIYYERTYYLGPDKGSEKTFALLGKAMEDANRAAIGKLTMRNHEYLALIRVAKNGMMVHLMLYQDEIIENENRFKKIEIRPKEIQLAQQLIENLTDRFEPEKFKDEYQERVEQLIESKISGKKLRIVKPKAKPKVADLMEALQRSVEQTSKNRAAKPVARARKKAS